MFEAYLRSQGLQARGGQIIVENLRGVQAGWDGRDFSWSRNGETIVTIENMMDLIDNRSLRLAQGGITIA